MGTIELVLRDVGQVFKITCWNCDRKFKHKILITKS